MAVRILPGFLCICLAIAGCKNEPYETYPLGVTSLTNQVSKQTQTYTYRNQKLRSFISKLSTDTLALMNFRYANGNLQFMTGDSTSTSIEKTFVYNSGDHSVDSTFLIDPDTTMLLSARTITYNGEGYPASVSLWKRTEVTVTEEEVTTIEIVVTDQLAELTWSDGNVVHLTVSDMITGEKVIIKDLTITHDDQFCVFMNIPEYVYTLKLDELYWLSKNNPLTFNDGARETSNTFQYNRLGYPSSYQSPTGTIYGMSYTQVR